MSISRWWAIVKAQPYPGEATSPQQVYELAEQYRRGAHLLLKTCGQRGQPLSWAPFRLCAIQAIELYLNALLLSRGTTAEEIRALQHRLQERLALALKGGINLRVRTQAHIRTLDENREYLVTRYGPELIATTSQLNRLTATLDEVAQKVSQLLLVDAAKAMPPVRSR